MRERFPQFLRQVCSGVCRLKGRMDRRTYLVDCLAGPWTRYREVRSAHVERLVELDFSEVMLHERRLYRLGMRRREREHWIAYEIGRLSQGWGLLGLERALGSCAGTGLPVVSVGRQLSVMKCRLIGRRRHVCAWGRALGRMRRRGVGWAGVFKRSRPGEPWGGEILRERTIGTEDAHAGSDHDGCRPR